jgi:hypothetical protein
MTLTATDNALTSLSLADGQNVTLTDNGTGGITVSGASDNSHVTLNLSGGAIAGKIDNITLGNANNSITDATTLGTVNVTVGTGSNAISLGGTTTDTTAVYNVTLGAHTAASGFDQISVGTAGTNFATVPNLVVTGAVTGDHIVFAGDANVVTVAATATAAGATQAATIAALEAAATTAHAVAFSVFNGNTYVVENVAVAAAGATNTHVVELIGVHTFTAGAAGHLVVAS